MNHLTRLSTVVLTVVACCGPILGAEGAEGAEEATREFRLDRLDIALVASGWGKARWNAGVGERALQIGAETFNRGLGTHARSDLHVRVFRAAKRFTAKVGVDASARKAADKARIEFRVLGDDKVLWKSGLMCRDDTAKRVDVGLVGVNVLSLEVTDGGNGKDGDYAAWADAVIVTAGRDPKAVPPSPAAHFRALDPFYKQYVSAGGLIIAASDKVSPHALKEAAYLVDKLLATRPDVLAALIRNRIRVGVMAYTEMTTAIPAHRGLGVWYDKRARGLGNNPVTCGEENLLDFKGDPYRGENIFIHEFAHIIDGRGFRAIDKTFKDRLEALYEKTKATGRFRGYGMTSYGEFWAEGVQSWFHCNRGGGLEALDANGKRVCVINTRSDLKKHMPVLAKILAASFPGNGWTYVPVKDRLNEPHLKGYDPAAAPTFKWPAYVIEGARKVEAERRKKRAAEAARKKRQADKARK